jgi:hypothetical protein
MELLFLWLLFVLIRAIFPDDGSSNCGNDVFIPFEGQHHNDDVYKDKQEYYPYDNEDFDGF